MFVVKTLPQSVRAERSRYWCFQNVDVTVLSANKMLVGLLKAHRSLGLVVEGASRRQMQHLSTELAVNLCPSLAI